MRLSGGLPEVPCVKCGTRVRGLGWGELCPDCLAERRRRATRLARRISLAATALIGAYVALRFPADPGSRLYGAVLVAATYLIVRRSAPRRALELQPR